MNEARRILVLHAGALGDCVLTLHVIRALKSTRGNMSITMAARSPIVHWAKRVGLVDEATSLDQIGTHALYHPDAELPDHTVEFFRQHDVIVSFLGDPSEAVSVRLADIGRGDVLALDPRPTKSTLREGVHIIQQWAQAIRSAGLELADHSDVRWSLSSSIRDSWRARLASRLGTRSSRIVLCHPGSGGLAKCCPIDALEQLITTLFDRGWTGAWMIGPDEIERFGSSYRNRLEESAPVIYEESVEQAAELACGARVYIGNDAGMTHVAAIAGVPTIAIFGTTDPGVWRPLGSATTVVAFPGEAQPHDAWTADVLTDLEGNLDPAVEMN